jgi:hypothetical protein
MDCSHLLGEQLDALDRLVRILAQAGPGAARRAAWREVLDRASAHFHVREQIVNAAFRHAGWRGLDGDAQAAHLEMRRALAALCICEPGDADFDGFLERFADALAHQRVVDEDVVVPALRALLSREDRRQLCELIETMQDALVPPPSHYLGGETLVDDAAVVLTSLGPRRVPSERRRA